MGTSFSRDAAATAGELAKVKLTRGQKYAEAKIYKLERDYETAKIALDENGGVEEVSLGPIDIQDRPLRDLGAIMIGDYLEKDDCKCGKLLLRKNDISPVGCSRLATSLQKNKTLREMSIVENHMRDEEKGGLNTIEDTMSTLGSALVSRADAALVLGAALGTNISLQKLHLEENLLGSEGCAAFCEGLKENTTLTDLTIQRNEMSSKGVEALTKFLQINRSLVRLDLQENQIGDHGVTALCAALDTNTTLLEVNLRANFLTPAACDVLAVMLQTNKTLVELNLRRNALKDEGCSTLGKALVDTNIKRLYLSSNLIGCHGCAQLAESLEQNNVLEELYLEINNIEDKGCVRLAEAIENNKALTKVDLQMNNFGGLGYARLAKAVDRNAILQHLNLSSSLMESKEPVKHIHAVLTSRAPQLEADDGCTQPTPLVPWTDTDATPPSSHASSRASSVSPPFPLGAVGASSLSRDPADQTLGRSGSHARLDRLSPHLATVAERQSSNASNQASRESLISEKTES